MTAADPGLCVAQAIELGWWMADLYQYAKPKRLMHPDGRPPAPPEMLADLSHVPPRTHVRMYLDGVDVALNRIAARNPAACAVPPTTEIRRQLSALALRDVQAATDLRCAINSLHVDVLTWVMSVDRRTGHGYLLGRMLADATRDRSADLTRMRDEFTGPRIQIGKWLDEVACYLPDRSARVVSASLEMWAAAVRDAAGADSAHQVRLAQLINEQGKVWRSLLTGGLDTSELLRGVDYTDIAQAVVAADRALVAKVIRRALPPVAVPLLLATLTAVVVAAVAAHGSPAVRIAAALLAVGGGVLAVWRGISRQTVRAMSAVSRPRYEDELVAHMAFRASWPLWGATPTPELAEPSGDTVRRLVLTAAGAGRP